MKLPQWVFSGKVNANGLLIPNSKSAKKIQSTILQCWQPGAELYKFSSFYILIYAQPVQLVCELTPGYALVKKGTRYVSGDHFSDDECYPHTVTHNNQGQVQHYKLSDSVRCHPGEWVTLENYNVITLTELAFPPAKPKLIDNKIDKRTRDVFGAEKFAASSEQQTLADALKEAGKSTRSAPTQKPSFWQKMLFQLAKRLDTPAHHSSNNTTVEHSTSVDQSSSQRLVKPRGWQQWLMKKLLTSRLGAFIGHQQASYLKNMLEMFQQGNFDEALKHAISIDNMPTSPQQNMPSGWLSQQRNALSFSNEQTSGTSYLNVHDDLNNHLRDVYQQSFRQLDQAGRYKDAAFVLGELLNKHDDAVSYLEQKKMYQLAAELAEAKQFSIARVIRLWMLAGEKKHALWLALSTKQLPEAINLLEKTHPDLAEALKVYSARQYALAGDYLNAITIGLGVAELEDEITAWFAYLEQVTDSALSLKLHVHGLYYDKANASHHAQILHNLFQIQENTNAETDSIRNHLRLQVINELIALKPYTTAIAWVAKLATRCYYRLAEHGEYQLSSDILKKLLSKIDDPCFLSEARKVKIQREWQGLNQRTNLPLCFSLSTSCPQTPLFDVVCFDNFNLLVAQGDTGLKLIDITGKTIQKYSQPGHKLIPSDHGNKALIICQRSTFISLAEFELASRKLTLIGDFEIDHWAKTYDGTFWFCANKQSIYCFDFLTDPGSTHWQINDLPGNVIYIERNEQDINILIETQHDIQFWSYRFPALTLKWREPIKHCTFEKALGITMLSNTQQVIIAKYVEEQALLLGCQSLVNISSSQSAYQNVPMSSGTLERKWFSFPLTGNLAGFYQLSYFHNVAVISYQTEAYHVSLFSMKQPITRRSNKFEKELINITADGPLQITHYQHYMIVFSRSGSILVINTLTGQKINQLNI
ncbi:tetratricopeptide repeat protein [Zooshikella sp. RANM57]|uniref:tetratricopeptide repeat protein n=1 Tax=Zooshikella sp. RANM57 TaxID=3425863 RepID=UPI003D6F2315